MKFCPKCGTKLEEGDIYCPNCGGRVSDTDDAVENQQTNPRNNIKADISLKPAANVFINMFLKPVTTAEGFIQNGKKDTLVILTVFVALIQGLFGMWRINQIISNINEIIIQWINKIYQIMELIYPSGSPDSVSNEDVNLIITGINRIKSGIKVPYGEIFLQNCIVVLIPVLMIFVMICLANTLLSRNKPQIFKFYKTALVVIIPILYFEFFSIIFSYISIGFGLVLILFGFMVSAVCLTMLVNESMKISKNCTLFVVAFIFVVTAVVVLVFSQRAILSTLSSIISSIVSSVEGLSL